MKHSSLIPVERIEKAIYLIPGEKVMLDRDLANLYDVPTRVFNPAVKRHADRFLGKLKQTLNLGKTSIMMLLNTWTSA